MGGRHPAAVATAICAGGAAAQFSLNHCQTARAAFRVHGLVQDKPCPVEVLDVTTAPDSKLIVACRFNGSYVCHSDRLTLLPAAPVDCEPIGFLGCRPLPRFAAVQASVAGVSFIPTSNSIVAGCGMGGGVTSCRWNSTTSNVSSCEPIVNADCMGMAFETGVLVLPDDPNVLLISCWSVNDSNRLPAAFPMLHVFPEDHAGVMMCNLSSTGAVCRQAPRARNPCFVNWQWAISMDSARRIVIGCDLDGHAYCDFDPIQGPFNCVRRAGPCRATTGIFQLPAGATLVTCNTNGVKLCGVDPTGSPNVLPTASPAAPVPAPSGLPTVPPTLSPSQAPVAIPTLGPPTEVPQAPSSLIPTARPTARPSRRPTARPSRPTARPSRRPSLTHPSVTHTVPAEHPTASPKSSPRPSAAPERVTSPPSALLSVTLSFAVEPTSPPAEEHLVVEEHIVAGDGDLTSVVASLVAVTGTGAGVAPVAMTALETKCNRLGTLQRMSRVLHPTQLSIDGSPHLGCVACINYGAVVILRQLDADGGGYITRATVAQSFLRHIPVVKDTDNTDIAAVARFPNLMMLAIIFLYQGVAFSAQRLALGGEQPLWRRLVGVAVSALSFAFVFWIRYRVRNGVSPALHGCDPTEHVPYRLARVRQWDPPLRPPLALQFMVLAERGDWVSCRRSRHWTLSWNSVVQPFLSKRATGGITADLLTMWALGLVNAPATPTAAPCGHVRLATAVVMASKFLHNALACPYRARRDAVVTLFTQAFLMAALLMLAGDFYRGQLESDRAEALLAAATACSLVRVAASVGQFLLLLVMPWRAHSQELEWGVLPDRAAQDSPALDLRGDTSYYRELPETEGSRGVAVRRAHAAAAQPIDRDSLLTPASPPPQQLQSLLPPRAEQGAAPPQPRPHRAVPKYGAAPQHGAAQQHQEDHVVASFPQTLPLQPLSHQPPGPGLPFPRLPASPLTGPAAPEPQLVLPYGPGGGPERPTAAELSLFLSAGGQGRPGSRALPHRVPAPAPPAVSPFIIVGPNSVLL
eukprot:TRINITY_DN9385_c0_g1_i3.p1 TRINITY_DN9385_c0_g1~~TRINITY_DN9385_c0_g1_i3.p1  ORF type:complete len:1055 (+),score=108.05 TRINITY_DN9385_c0_g1_i3:74-3166(+)